MAENPRTTSARDNDDTDLIEGLTAEGGGANASSAGGRLQTDVGSRDDVEHAVFEPGGTSRPEKSDDIANDQAYNSSRPRGV